MATTARVTILFDNQPGVPGLTSLWGFAALIETGERTLLFDTGSNGRILLQNAAALGVALGAAELVFLSHQHWDHIGGLDSVIEINAGITVVVSEGFSAHLVRDLRTLCREVIVVGSEPRQLVPGVFSTGALAGPLTEQGMILDLGGVTAAISGCAHPGIERIVERGAVLLGKPIDWAIGGFHLAQTDSTGIAHLIRRLRDLGVSDVAPTHCSGASAQAAFARAYGERCHAGGVGRVIDLSAQQLS